MKKWVKILMVLLLFMVIIAALIAYFGDINVLKQIFNTVVNFFSNELVGKSMDVFN